MEGFKNGIGLKELIKYVNPFNPINLALADQAMISGVNFFTAIFLARFLGRDEFGQFTLVWMTVLFVQSIQMAMIGAPMMSIGIKQSAEDVGAYYRAVIFQQVLFSSVTFGILFLGVKVVVVSMPEWGLVGYAFPLATAGFTFQNQDFLRRYFFSRQLSACAFWNDAVSYLGRIILLGALFFTWKISVIDVLWVIALTCAAAMCIGLYRVFSIDRKFSNIDELKKVTKRHWNFSKWSTLGELFRWASGDLVYVLVGVIYGRGAVGVLKAVQNITAVFNILFLGMENFVPVQASERYANGGVPALQLFTKKILIVGCSAVALFALIMAVFAEQLLNVFYGKDYFEYAYILQWFSLIYIVAFVGFALRSVLRAIENIKAIFLSRGLASAFVILFGYLFVTRFGLSGALCCLLFIEVISTAYLSVAFLKTIRILKALPIKKLRRF